MSMKCRMVSNKSKMIEKHKTKKLKNMIPQNSCKLPYKK
jgi:hypothetical protein